MSLVVILFSLIASVIAVSSICVVVSRSVVRAALGLLFTLIGISLLYFLLGAEFLGASQLIIYVGGTMVLVVFGVMITNQGPFAGFVVRRKEWFIGGSLASIMFAILVTASLNQHRQPSDEPMPSVDALGASLLGVSQRTNETTYLLPFEIASVHLLIVLIAAAYLARAKRKVPTPAVTAPTHGEKLHE